MDLNLKILEVSDVTQSYVQWYENTDVVRFSNNQYRSFTLEGQRNYVSDCLNNPNEDLYGIFDGGYHIGNIIISDLQSTHKRSEIMYVVGDTKYWGKGVGTFAISSIVTKAKNDYRLNKLYAGVVEENIGSIRALEKNGFIVEGKKLQHLFLCGKFHNQLEFGLVL